MTNTNGQGPEQIIASGAALRKARRETYPVPLLTGEYVLMRPIDLGALALAGEIPDLLLPAAYRALFGDLVRDADDEKQSILDTLALVRLILPLALASPRIVDDPQADDEIALSDLDWPDQYFLFSRAIQGVSALRIFRERQAPDVAAGPNGATIRDATEPPTGD